MPQARSLVEIRLSGDGIKQETGNCYRNEIPAVCLVVMPY